MKKVTTVCPYCASGCKMQLTVEEGKITRADAAMGKNNQGTLCLKGCYGWDFIDDPQILTPRLKTPMIRRRRGGKLESVSWEEALDYVANRLSDIKAKYGRMRFRPPDLRAPPAMKPTTSCKNLRAPLLVPITSTAAHASDTALRLQVCTSRSATAR